MQPPREDHGWLEIHFSPTPHHTATGDLPSCFCWKWNGLSHSLHFHTCPMTVLDVNPKTCAPMTHPTYDSPGIFSGGKLVQFHQVCSLKGQLDVPLTVYPWYLLCSLGILRDYNP